MSVPLPLPLPLGAAASTGGPSSRSETGSTAPLSRATSAEGILPSSSSSVVVAGPGAGAGAAETAVGAHANASASALVAMPHHLPWRPSVILTTLAHVPGTRVERYMGRINLHFIKESSAVRETFHHSFVLHVQAIARAHVRALGGNALLSCRVVRRETDTSSKSQAYNLMSIAGDAALVVAHP